MPHNPTLLHTLDLNLLLALDALLDERHVTRAATRLGLSQSAMSHRLAKLRAMLDDEILVSGPDGLCPTGYAEAIREPLAEAINLFRQILSFRSEFDRGTSTREFRIGADDYGTLLLVPQLVARAMSVAPNLSLVARPLQIGEVEQQLVSRRLDLAISVEIDRNMVEFGDSHQGELRRKKLWDESFLTVGRRGLVAGDTLTLETFCELPHVLISPSGEGDGIVDVQLRCLGYERTIYARVSHFLASPFVALETNALLTLPSRIARYYAEFLPLAVYPTPVELPTYSIILVWLSRFQDDPAHIWLRDTISDLSTGC